MNNGFIVIYYLILEDVVDFLCLFIDYESSIVICMDFFYNID